MPISLQLQRGGLEPTLPTSRSALSARSGSLPGVSSTNDTPAGESMPQLSPIWVDDLEVCSAPSPGSPQNRTAVPTVVTGLLTHFQLYVSLQSHLPMPLPLFPGNYLKQTTATRILVSGSVSGGPQTMVLWIRNGIYPSYGHICSGKAKNQLSTIWNFWESGERQVSGRWRRSAACPLEDH